MLKSYQLYKVRSTESLYIPGIAKCKDSIKHIFFSHSAVSISKWLGIWRSSLILSAHICFFALIEFALILNILKGRDERWEILAASLSKLGIFESSVGVPNFYFPHCSVFQDATLSSILSCFISYIQATFHLTEERVSVT